MICTSNSLLPKVFQYVRAEEAPKHPSIQVSWQIISRLPAEREPGQETADEIAAAEAALAAHRAAHADNGDGSGRSDDDGQDAMIDALAAAETAYDAAHPEAAPSGTAGNRLRGAANGDGAAQEGTLLPLSYVASPQLPVSVCMMPLLLPVMSCRFGLARFTVGCHNVVQLRPCPKCHDLTVAGSHILSQITRCPHRPGALSRRCQAGPGSGG